MQEQEQATIQNIIKTMKLNNKKSNSHLIQKAYNYAVSNHKDQKRLSGEDYIVHPLQVAKILADLKMDDATICAALLHDVVEDTPITNEDITREFGEEIAEMVAGVTKLGKIQYVTVTEQQVENYRKMFLAMGKDIRVILIKLADRLHNMRTLSYLKRDRQIANAKETMELYAPLANRLGIYSLKWELEDLAFKYLQPEEYKELILGIEKKREERLEFIDNIMNEIKKELKKRRIEAEITGRAKHLYSIYRKMQRDNITLEQVYDLFALRIIVNSIKDCYAALGVVHELYNPMPGRFKDYIAMPKTNLYQSLHTTVFGIDGELFEIQIRTYDMDKIAEYGIASHWSYKENKTISSKDLMDQKLEIFRNIIELNEDSKTPEEFISSVKKDILFNDSIYVYTPKGDVIELPKGATCVDFAYRVHTEVGDRMVGAIVNDNIVPFDYTLKTGDIIKVNTSKLSKGPNKDWLNFVITTQAKNKIKAFYTKREKDDALERGIEIFENALRKKNLPIQITLEKYLNIILDTFKLKGLDDLYLAIGTGKYIEFLSEKK